jgi:hypothetical protein
MKKFLLMAGLTAMFMASTVSASTLCGGGATDVSVAAFQYVCDGVTFSNFVVSPHPPATIGIGTGSNIDGNDINLDFQISGITSNTFDTLLFYTVTGATQGVDLHFQAANSDTGNVRIIETVCDQAFSNNTCADGHVLANFQLTSNGNVASNTTLFAVHSQVFVKKDIQFNGDTLSDFVNSHVVPEPMTMSLMGVGLLGLGLLGRKIRK